ncbi:MAG: hypothetical protein OEM38_07890 [Gammaproteobacteria bacterium]|nr:hypothetical protein [Gammaproteobacteria bacterium]
MPIPHTTLTFQETMSGFFSLGTTEYKKGSKEGRFADTKLAMHASVKIVERIAYNIED